MNRQYDYQEEAEEKIKNPASFQFWGEIWPVDMMNGEPNYEPTSEGAEKFLETFLQEVESLIFNEEAYKHSWNFAAFEKNGTITFFSNVPTRCSMVRLIKSMEIVIRAINGANNKLSISSHDMDQDGCVLFMARAFAGKYGRFIESALRPKGGEAKADDALDTEAEAA